jgi:RNA polymerase II elongation factor ELL
VRTLRGMEPAPLLAKPPHRAVRPISPERDVVSVTQPQRVRKMREDASGGTDTEREKHAGHVRALRKEKTRTREQGATESKHAVEEDPSTVKRKKVGCDDDDYEATSSRPASQKKRRLENGLVCTSSKEPRVKDQSLPRKPELAPTFRSKVRRQPSPLSQQPPLPKIKKDVTRTSLSTQEGKDESTPPSSHIEPRVAHKTRRRSPVYTSSEEEHLIRSPRQAMPAGPLLTPPVTTHRGSPAVPATHLHLRNHSHVSETRPLPTDHANLRARYSASYLEYLSKFHKLVAQKGKLDSMLKSRDIASAGSITDSDGEVGLMDPEDLARLSSEYKVLEEELETIRNVFSSQQ